MRKYTPRRATQRWNEGAPEWVLDCFYNPQFADCYTIFFGAADAFHVLRDGTIVEGCGEYGQTYLIGIGTSENGGVSGSLEMTAWDVVNYRYRNKHRRIAWRNLPEATRALVTRWHDQGDEA